MTDTSLEDTTDFEDADRGFVAALKPGVVKDASGRVVWDSDAFAHLMTDPAPSTVNPSLWRQAPCAHGRGCTRSPRAYTRSVGWTCRT
ncbi:hypothetical protein SCHAM137S_06019 [Streptomyces chartreusis]